MTNPIDSIDWGDNPPTPLARFNATARLAREILPSVIKANGHGGIGNAFDAFNIADIFFHESIRRGREAWAEEVGTKNA